MKVFSEFVKDIKSETYKYGRLSVIFEQEETCTVEGMTIKRNRIATIKRYYESTNDYNRSKIDQMINNDIKNVDVVFDMILTINGA